MRDVNERDSLGKTYSFEAKKIAYGLIQQVNSDLPIVNDPIFNTAPPAPIKHGPEWI
jgi:hypothetical protein